MDLQTKSSPVADTIAAIKGIPTREDLLDILLHGVVVITFNKLNGDERVMTCTLVPEHLPPATREDPLSQTKIRNIEDKTIVVWDLSAKAWRSFRYDRVSKVEPSIQVG